jgi:retinol dehydrogenase 12
VNDLSCVLLSILLLPRLLKTPKDRPRPRLVVVSSDVHYYASLAKEISSPKILDKLNEKEYCTASGYVPGIGCLEPGKSDTA